MWHTRPIILQIKGARLRLKFSSLRVYQCSLGLAALSLVLAGWLFGSGLLALKTMFEPSEGISLNTGKILPSLRQERVKQAETSGNSDVRWTTTNNASAGIRPTGIVMEKRGTGHE